MSTRVQVILEEHEKQTFRVAADRAGKSLSSWIKECVLSRLEASLERQAPQNLNELRCFFEECDKREVGEEPDWIEYRHVITRSATSGITET
ncbi:MAG: hypothetical protein GY854_16785 [Deltaproteobacteria bacterium]|nr:hypothetical protein [Deltaproteobacteria bacterium]